MFFRITTCVHRLPCSAEPYFFVYCMFQWWNLACEYAHVGLRCLFDLCGTLGRSRSAAALCPVVSLSGVLQSEWNAPAIQFASQAWPSDAGKGDGVCFARSAIHEMSICIVLTVRLLSVFTSLPFSPHFAHPASFVIPKLPARVALPFSGGTHF